VDRPDVASAAGVPTLRLDHELRTPVNPARTQR